jgi:hypothetical protein
MAPVEPAVVTGAASLAVVAVAPLLLAVVLLLDVLSHPADAIKKAARTAEAATDRNFEVIAVLPLTARARVQAGARNRSLALSGLDGERSPGGLAGRMEFHRRQRGGFNAPLFVNMKKG